MNTHILQDYIKQKNLPIIKKRKNTYLYYNEILSSHIYLLKSGILKMSLILKDGREFNYSYMNKPDVVAILRDEDDPSVPAPCNVRIESDEAILYQIERQTFWQDVNTNPELLLYIKNYYRRQLNEQIFHMQTMLMNGKFGALVALLIRLSEQFGVETTDGVLIDFLITNEDIAGFCGIGSHTSVNRMMKELREEGAIEIIQRKILIKRMDYLQDHLAL